MSVPDLNRALDFMADSLMMLKRERCIDRGGPTDLAPMLYVIFDDGSHDVDVLLSDREAIPELLRRIWLDRLGEAQFVYIGFLMDAYHRQVEVPREGADDQLAYARALAQQRAERAEVHRVGLVVAAALAETRRAVVPVRVGHLHFVEPVRLHVEQQHDQHLGDAHIASVEGGRRETARVGRLHRPDERAGHRELEPDRRRRLGATQHARPRGRRGPPCLPAGGQQVNRRQFLAKSAAAGTLAWSVPTIVTVARADAASRIGSPPPRTAPPPATSPPQASPPTTVPQMGPALPPALPPELPFTGQEAQRHAVIGGAAAATGAALVALTRKERRVE